MFVEAGIKKSLIKMESQVDKVYRIAEYSSDEVSRMTVDEKLDAILKNFSKY